MNRVKQFFHIGYSLLVKHRHHYQANSHRMQKAHAIYKKLGRSTLRASLKEDLQRQLKEEVQENE